MSTPADEPLDLDRLEALAKAATPGPWIAIGDYGVGLRGGQNNEAYRAAGGWDRMGWPVLFRCQSAVDYGANCQERPHNVRFVAAAREAVPALIAEVRRLRAEGDLVEFYKARMVEHREAAIASRKRAEAAEAELAEARRRCEGLAERVAQQSELLARKAEKPHEHGDGPPA